MSAPQSLNDVVNTALAGNGTATFTVPGTVTTSNGPIVTPPPAPTPPWGTDEEFSPDKAWALIQDLKADKEKVAARAFQTPEAFQAAQQALESVEAVKNAAKTDLQRQSEETARWQTEATKWREQSVRSQVEALAAVDFADPSDAAAAIGDASQFIGADGSVDTAAIRKNLDDLLERKPHYRRPDAAAGPVTRAPAPNRSQGAGGAPVLDPRAEFGAFIASQLS